MRPFACSPATGDVAPDDQRLDGLSASVGVDGLDVGEVPDDAVAQQDAVAAEQVAGFGGDDAGGVHHDGRLVTFDRAIPLRAVVGERRRCLPRWSGGHPGG